MSNLALAKKFGGEWRVLVAHSSYYFARDGRAARVDGDRMRLLIGCTSGQQGYRAISYPKGNGRYQRVYIHRAVCELFHGPAPATGLHVRHLDCDKSNNAASNLAWGTPQENSEDGKRNGKILRGEANPMSRLTRAQVEEMRHIRAESGAFYYVIAEKFGVSRMTAHRAITGRAWQ